MSGFAPFILPITRAAVVTLLQMSGIDTEKGLADLAKSGVCRIGASVKITFARRRYHVIDEGNVGGENLAPLLPQHRHDLPAAQPDGDGTTFEQRQADAREAARQDRVRHALFVG